MRAERPRRWTRGARALTVARLWAGERAPRAAPPAAYPRGPRRGIVEAGAIRSSALALNELCRRQYQ